MFCFLVENQYAQDGCEHPDFKSLMEFYENFNGNEWDQNYGWIDAFNGSNCDPCNNWAGVFCNDENRVRSISLNNNNLIGDIYNFSFPQLSTLQLNGNVISGNIPDFDSIPKITGIWLEANQLTGTIPNFANIENLQTLSLSRNSLSSQIPGFDKLFNLQRINLGRNSLTGEIPNFEHSPNLYEIHLNDNELSGQIPSFNSQDSITSLLLTRNNLSGNIPSFANQKYLLRFSASDNNLSGDIPSFQDNLKLNWIFLNDNNLTGSIPNFTNHSFLTSLNLENNNLEGCFEGDYFCNTTFSFDNNPRLPWFGDFTNFCAGQSQFNVPCDDGRTETINDIILDDCSCEGELTSNSSAVKINPIRIFPNPTYSILKIENAASESIRIFNEQGVQFAIESLGDFTYNLSHLKSGIYYFVSNDSLFKIIKI